jgi:hypothetical protein
MTYDLASVAVIIPFRGDGGPRDEALRFVCCWWQSNHPCWPVTVGRAAADGPWCKAAAVRAGLAAAPPAQLVVVSDADVICESVGRAIDNVAQGAASWAIPHRRVYRLNPAATTAVYGGAAFPDPDRIASGRRAPHHRPASRVVDEVHAPVVGGGLVVLPRALYETVPLDPRFKGWGQEDDSWGHALTVVAGHPWRGAAPLWHLWHPKPLQAHSADPTTLTRLTRSIGNTDGLALYRRYRDAKTPAAIGALIAEIGLC